MSEVDKAQHLLEEVEFGGRKPRGWVRWLVLGLAVGWSLFQMYATYVGTLNDLVWRATHLAFAFALVFLVYPFGKRSSRSRVPWFDWVLGVAAVGSALYAVFEYRGILEERGGFGNRTDIWVASSTVVMLLLAAWRAIGPAMPIIAGVFMLFALSGPAGLIKLELPGILGDLHAGASWRSLMNQLFMNTNDSIWGTPIAVSAETVFVFVLFGAILDRAGAGQFFTDLAYSLLGGVRGGPAKASIIASALNGIVSGSSVSNVVTGGHFTISTMIRAGYTREKAGAIEVASSSNGQLMPPVMGAAAFIMADLLGVPYPQIIIFAILPAILAYGSLLVVADLEAAKLGLRGMARSELPDFGKTLRSGLHYLLVLGFLLYCLLFDDPFRAGINGPLTPNTSALYTVFALMLVVLAQELYLGWRRGNLVMGLRSGAQMIVEGLENGARNMVGIAIATAVAGIIVGVVLITNVGTGLADVMRTLSFGNFIAALLLAQLISLFLGMGVPTTANYVIMATLIAPTLFKLGGEAGLDYGSLTFGTNEVAILLICINFFAFYFGIMADSTPPVALAAYAAAAISKGDPFKTGVQGFVYELRTALLAYMIVFDPKILLIGVSSFGEGVWIAVTALLGMAAFAVATIGYLAGNVNWLLRLVMLAVALLLVSSGFVSDFIGIALFATIYAWQRFVLSRRPVQT